VWGLLPDRNEHHNRSSTLAETLSLRRRGQDPPSPRQSHDALNSATASVQCIRTAVIAATCCRSWFQSLLCSLARQSTDQTISRSSFPSVVWNISPKSPLFETDVKQTGVMAFLKVLVAEANPHDGKEIISSARRYRTEPLRGGVHCHLFQQTISHLRRRNLPTRDSLGSGCPDDVASQSQLHRPYAPARGAAGRTCDGPSRENSAGQLPRSLGFFYPILRLVLVLGPGCIARPLTRWFLGAVNVSGDLGCLASSGHGTARCSRPVCAELQVQLLRSYVPLASVLCWLRGSILGGSRHVESPSSQCLSETRKDELPGAEQRRERPGQQADAIAPAPNLQVSQWLTAEVSSPAIQSPAATTAKGTVSANNLLSQTAMQMNFSHARREPFETDTPSPL
jgi:hypothetical protein